MQYRRFGKTDWQVSEISMGGSWFYGRPEYGLLPVSHGVAMVERAFELGINYFDTAPLYGQGRSEEVLGHALKGVTEPYYLATKVGYHPSPYDYTRDTVWRGFEASLQRLQRDSVDLVQIHEAEQAGWDGIFGRGRTLDALREIREQGLAQHIGLTGSDLELMRDVLAECDDFVSVITFLKYDMLVQTAREILLPTAAAAQPVCALKCEAPVDAARAPLERVAVLDRSHPMLKRSFLRPAGTAGTGSSVCPASIGRHVWLAVIPERAGVRRVGPPAPPVLTSANQVMYGTSGATRPGIENDK